jgi:hypothetical protein
MSFLRQGRAQGSIIVGKIAGKIDVIVLLAEHWAVQDDSAMRRNEPT